MSNMSDRERAIYFEGRMHEDAADLKWVRQQLKEAHRIIGVLIHHATSGEAAIPNIGDFWPGLSLKSDTPGKTRFEEFNATITKSQGEQP